MLAVHEHPLCALGGDLLSVRPLLTRVPERRHRTFVLEAEVVLEEGVPLLVENPEEVRGVCGVRVGVTNRGDPRRGYLVCPSRAVLGDKAVNHPRSEACGDEIESASDPFLVCQRCHFRTDLRSIAACSLSLTNSDQESINALYRS